MPAAPQLGRVAIGKNVGFATKRILNPDEVGPVPNRRIECLQSLPAGRRHGIGVIKRVWGYTVRIGIHLAVTIGVALVACAAFGLLDSAPALAQTQQQIDWCVNKGNVFAPDLAIGGCTASIQSGRWSGKNLAWAFQDRGLAFRAKRDYDRAIADFDQAIRLDPKMSDAFRERGAAYMDEQDCDRAFADMNKAIELNPRDGAAFSNRSRCWRARGDLDRTQADLTEALKLNPKEGYPFRERGVILFSKGDFAAAASDLQRAIESEAQPNIYAAVYRFLARTRAGENATSELEQNATRFNTRDWPYPLIELFLGRRTVEDTIAAARSPNDRCEADFYVGEWHLLRGNREDARARFQSAANSCPKSFGEYLIAAGELQRLAK
jgi:lipoprotein NlpI